MVSAQSERESGTSPLPSQRQGESDRPTLSTERQGQGLHTPLPSQPEIPGHSRSILSASVEATERGSKIMQLILDDLKRSLSAVPIEKVPILLGALAAMTAEV